MAKMSDITQTLDVEVGGCPLCKKRIVAQVTVRLTGLAPNGGNAESVKSGLMAATVRAEQVAIVHHCSRAEVAGEVQPG